ncbi:hypothetical protein QIA17_05745 (plasmid) [Borreliella californiensis]|uniref:Putative nucleic acid-binding Zn-ribbon protein n=1 Tax=Borreliella californiensis TaxID=373543 RepID=A0A7W9ZN11_9SPIR|nr:hypothetical protein [Borreliella californiensis]MBB6213883.1 putative nucleic acid-binding Zn-ribbon protein [Borreliella californiensis]
MNKKIKMFIICLVFVLIISCKNYSNSKDLKQNAERKIKGFSDKILDPKDKITSSGPKVDELAKKLQEEENEKDVNLEEKEGLKNDLKDYNDGKVLKPEPIALESKEPKLETAEILKPELPEEPKLPVVLKPVVKEKTEEGKAKDRKDEELRKRRIEKYQKEEEERLKRKEEREKRKKLRESESGENFLEGVTKGKISTVAEQIDKIISDINSINPGAPFEESSEISGKEVEDRVTGAIYDDITDMSTRGTSIYSEWGDYLEEEGELKGFLDQLEEARTELRIKIKESDSNTNKTTVKISDIKEDLEKLKDSLNNLKESLQSTANKEEIQKAIKCLMDPGDGSCKY